MPTKKFKASILVVTMMIMGIILVSALSISLVSIQERKASMGASKSNQAYQIADTGIELVMADIVKGNNDKTNELTGCQASDGLIHGTGYTVELKDADENQIACNTNTDLSEVIHIKSVGTASGQAQRSIEAAVAASGVIVCEKDISYGFTGEGKYAFSFSSADCGGALPTNSYIGIQKEISFCGGEYNTGVLENGETYGTDFQGTVTGPGISAWVVDPCSWGGSGIQGRAIIVYIKK